MVMVALLVLLGVVAGIWILMEIISPSDYDNNTGYG